MREGEGECEREDSAKTLHLRPISRKEKVSRRRGRVKGVEGGERKGKWNNEEGRIKMKSGGEKEK